MNSLRSPLLAANWKEHNCWDDCEAFIEQLRGLAPEYFQENFEPAVELLICPALPYLPILGQLIGEAQIFIGAQDVSRFTGGAYTGDVAAAMLADVGCDYALAGHSERRGVFGDTDLAVREKLLRLREAEIVPVLCVGEALELREAGRALEFTLGQLEALRDELIEHEPGALVIAYEPIWAIGTGRNAEPRDAQEMAAAIRGWLAARLTPSHAEATPILYGGSVKPENLGVYVAEADIDGALVGGASLKAESFAALLRVIEHSLP